MTPGRPPTPQVFPWYTVQLCSVTAGADSSPQVGRGSPSGTNGSHVQLK